VPHFSTMESVGHRDRYPTAFCATLQYHRVGWLVTKVGLDEQWD